jgi:hypothetical protein
VTLKGTKRAVTDVLVDAKPSRRNAGIREIELDPGDKARLSFDQAEGLRIEIRYVEPPPFVPRPRFKDLEPFLAKTVVLTSLVLGLFVASVMIFAHELENPPRNVLTAERVAKLLPPEPPLPPAPSNKKKDDEKTKEESGQMKKAKGNQGRLGKHDAEAKDTVIPKGDKDILRDKVSKIGLLGLIGKERPQGSGLAKLFSEERDLEQAVAGMQGARFVAGHGSGGLSTTGTGLGGGGTGMGHLYGAGDVDTGGRSSRGRGKGPTLSNRKEHEVKLDVGGGNVDEGGGLTKEQVARVVRAHQNAIKFCYEKELQRKPTLGGKIEVYWVIVPDGSVEKSKISVTTMDDGAVEGCIARQVKQWVFPKSDGRTVVQSYPFLFKGGA